MKYPLLSLLLTAGAACVGIGPAQAAVSCQISAIDAFHTGYDGLLPSPTLGSGTFTVTCSRDAAGDPQLIGVSATTDDGLYNKGNNNQAMLGADALTYDLFSDATYTANWTGSAKKAIASTVNLGTGVPATASTVLTYYSRIPTGQIGRPQGIYTDAVVIGLRYGDNTKGMNSWSGASSAPLSVQISNVPTCVFVTPPGTVAFNYTAFSPTAVTASTTFRTLCSTNHAYTMSLSDSSGTPTGLQTRGVLAGLQYTLTLSASTGIGSGTAQFYTINGSMPAGQAGACSGAICTETTSHTLTISY